MPLQAAATPRGGSGKATRGRYPPRPMTSIPTRSQAAAPRRESPHARPGRLRSRWLPASSLAFLGLLGCLSQESIEPPVVRPVLVHSVAPASSFQERSFPARAQAGTESILSFKVGGQVREVFVTVGERVRLDQPIAALDETDLRLELRQAEAGYAEARARDQNARAEFQRMKVLHDAEAASDNQLDAAETKSISARANLQAQAQAVALAKAHLGYADLRAPTDGLIAAVEIAVNENVRAGDPIVMLNAGGMPEVAFDVPENLIGSISRGQPATVRFTTIRDAVFPAEIIEVGVGTGRSAFPVTARLLESDDRLRAGMVAEATVRFARRQRPGGQPLVVPSFSVAEDHEGRFVYVAVAGEEGLAEIRRKDVETGELSVEGLEIESGLDAGDQVVIAGLRFVEPGMTVRILEP